MLKIISRILLVLGIFIIALLIYGFLLPNTTEFEVTKTLNANSIKVYKNVNDFRNWGKWSAWDKMDENMIKTYGKKSSGKNASYSWKSEKKNVGNGSMKITDSKPGLVNYEMDFDGQGSAQTWFKIVPKGIKSDVTWGFKSEESNPIGKLFMNLMMKKQIVKSYHESLDNLEKASQ